MTIHLSTSPSLSQTIWPRWAWTQFLSLPIVWTLLPVTFGYSLSSEAVIIRQLRWWKRLWRESLTRSHKRTNMGLPDFVRTVQQVHCSRRRLLRRGLSIKVPIRKKSGNWFNDPRIYIYIYIYIYICIYILLHEQDETFRADFTRFDFRVFLLLDWIPNQG